MRLSWDYKTMGRTHVLPSVPPVPLCSDAVPIQTTISSPTLTPVLDRDLNPSYYS